MFENSNGSVKEAMPNTEVVAKGSFEGRDVRALDIAKRQIGYNFHPPANYFPLIVHEALMIEPTETENKDALDRFADALIKIAEKDKTCPELLREAPHITPFGRMDEAKSARVGVAFLVAGGLRQPVISVQ